MTQHCCDAMKTHVADEAVGIVYVPQFREYGLKVADFVGGFSTQLIDYCPWCGARLLASLRDQWFDKIESLGYEWGDADIPST